MGDVLAPDVNNYVLGGAQFLFERAGTSGYVDLGNIPDFSQSSNATYLEHKTSRSGKLILDRKEQTEAGFTFKISTDEFNAANLAFILNAAAPSAFSQSSGTAATLSIATPTLGAKYDIGAFRITNLVVKVGDTTKALGTDYSVEADAGLIRILPTGTILSSDTVDLTFDKPAIAGNSVSPLSAQGLLKGAILLYFRASDGQLWRFKHTVASLSYDGDIALTGTEFAKASGSVVVEPDYTQAPNSFGVWTKLPAA